MPPGGQGLWEGSRLGERSTRAEFVHLAMVASEVVRPDGPPGDGEVTWLTPPGRDGGGT